ncbi:PUA domain-containing protein [Halobaculum halobium]|uniref:PUA domain-containing protein n=1 Tax=Halobaculum halobium TaxID=3032281 RepID=A0ABD5T7R6_9EURY|nr:PUA domain-containing protein [Halobaculum sp. SYNS20]
MSGDTTLDDLRTVADYQFGAGAGAALFPADEDVTVRRSTSGRPRQVTSDAGRVVSYRTNGRFTLGVEGGRRIRSVLPHPEYSVVVGDESAPFVRDGKNVFAKFVGEVGDAVRPRDEVVVVHEDGTVLGVGRAELAAAEMRDFSSGMAVKVRSGAGPE